ncbi:MAG TPA: hypothetical protein EYQ75_04940 [Planctomycetaceae bacterium]|nr:hypothetical protein [Planctomycetaceae bacterium]
MAQKTPKYSLHKASGQAFVYLDRKPKYLGKYRSPNSWQKYHRIVGQWKQVEVGSTDASCPAGFDA